MHYELRPDSSVIPCMVQQGNRDTRADGGAVRFIQ